MDHTWEHSKENAAPIATGRSIASLSRAALAAASKGDEDMEKTKKYEKLVRRSEKAAEWLHAEGERCRKQTTSDTASKSQHDDNDNDKNTELTPQQIDTLRLRLTQELGYNATTNNNGDETNIDHDPLRYWILYIKHIRTTHPSDTQRQFLLMERCCRTFLSTPLLHPEYTNDPRLVRTCILYADKTSTPSEVFRRMNSLKVGNGVALFWVAWAWLAEKRGEYSFCEKIFRKAQRVGAEPKRFLVEREKQFLRRMSRHWLNTTKNEDELDDVEEEEEEEGNGRRGALNEVDWRRGGRMGVERDENGGRSIAAGRPMTLSGTSGGNNTNHGNNGIAVNKAGFDIFQDDDNGHAERDAFDDDDDDDENRINGFRLTKECERTKENKMRAEQWNERGYGLINPSGPTAVDSIVSTRGTGSASYSVVAPAPAFDVFVDEEFENDENQNCKSGREKVEDRSLRQRLDGGTADRIRRDPLRYMKNPSKIVSDQEKYDPVSCSDARPDKVTAEAVHHKNGADSKNATSSALNKAESKLIDATTSNKGEPKQNRPSGGYEKELVKEDDSGHECCFEERRAISRYYKLTSSTCDFNLLKKQEDAEDMNSSQMDVEESMEEVDTEHFHTACAQKLKSSLKPPPSSLRTKDNADLNVSVINPRRVLFAANTEFPSNNESLNTSTASSQLNGSYVRDREETINTKFANAEISMMFCSPNNNESTSEHHGKSLLASSSQLPLFSTSRKQAVGPTSVVDDAPAAGASFAIFQDGDEEDADNSISNVNSMQHDKASKNNRCPPRPNPMGSFAIFQDDTDENVDNSIIHAKSKNRTDTRSNEEETVTMSALDEVLGGGGMSFGIYNDSPPKRNRPIEGKSTIKSSSRNSNIRPIKPLHRDAIHSGDDATASLSDIGAVLGGFQSCSIEGARTGAFTIFTDDDTEHNTSSKGGFTIHADVSQHDSTAENANGLKFEIFTDDNTSSSQKKRKVDEPCFGDISIIDNDEKTSNFHILDENADPTPSHPAAIDYVTKHKSDMESAMRQCMKEASKSSSDLQIFDYRKKPLPKELLRKSFASGTKIDLIGGGHATIAHELGRGVHGVVLLCNVASDSSEECNNDAFKIQAPIGSLAHEYSTLLKLEERIDLDDSGFYPFPQPQALYAFSEVGLFVMTAGSDSGMTLVDVVNTYNKSIGNVPEMVAIYYTSRMLRHLECLHRDGKILHCDVKPDNWVLTSPLKDGNNAGVDAIGGADLMLVDFGRAIDLQKASNKGSDPLKTVFTGSVAAEDMESKAMRQGLPWGVDLDFFGLCASSYILLFGSHIEVVQDKATGRLRLKKLLRRYWQRDLWQRYFETLLNFDTQSDEYCLRDIRLAFDEYIDGKDRKREIVSRIGQLFNHLPKKR
eukprot:CCRYP_015577-RA/>CCRYP_015577-RA protein AED:0.13 eAED:0.13 QI:0/1/0.66/1/1/1/3/321/1383